MFFDNFYFLVWFIFFFRGVCEKDEIEIVLFRVLLFLVFLLVVEREDFFVFLMFKVVSNIRCIICVLSILIEVKLR